MADNSLALSPGVLFAAKTKVDIPQLVRKPNDKFIVIPANKYASVLDYSVRHSSLSASFKYYLIELIKFALGEIDASKLEKVYEANKKDVDIASVRKYFGEVLGPLFLLKNNKGSIENVIFPVRSNYEVFDYFMQSKKSYVGYSAKISGATSNTLAPGLIYERIANSKAKPSSNQEKVAIEVVSLFANSKMFEGIVRAVGILVKNKIYPSTFDTAMKKNFDGINFANDAMILENSKVKGISKTQLSDSEKYKVYLDKEILPRSRTISSTDQKKYITGKLDYTCTNVVYGLGKYIEQVNNEDRFDLSPLVKLVFPDLNIIKIDINNKGIPKHTVTSASKSEDKYYFRSKHRWNVVKDKIGMQL